MSYVVDWQTGIRAAAENIDATFGETLIITPCHQAPNYPSEPYTEEAIEVIGVFSYKSMLALNTGGVLHRAHGEGGIVETRKPIASFSRSRLPWMLNSADRITRCCDGSTFEIISVEPDGVARITCHLVQLGVSDQ